MVDWISVGAGSAIGAVGLFITYRILISAIDWLTKNGLNQLKSETINRSETKDNNRTLEQVKRIEKQEKAIEKYGQRISEYERIVKTLQQDNISKEGLVEDYWKSLPVVLMSFAQQRDAEGRERKFLREYLEENYSATHLTSFTWVIPPAEVPERLREKSNRNEIRDWLSEEVYEDYPGHKAVIPFVTVVDLKNIYSQSDYSEVEVEDFYETIDRELGVDKIFSDEDFSRLLASENIDLAEIIQSGRITFFVSKFLSSNELEPIFKHKDEIQNDLNNPSLRELADNRMVDDIANVLGRYLDNPYEVAQNAVEEAKLWHRELNEESSKTTITPQSEIEVGA
jgi:hypothetical protein